MATSTFIAAVGGQAAQEYRLEASVLDVCSPEHLWLSPVFKWGPEYARLVNAGPNSMARFTKEQEVQGFDDIEEGTTTDRHELSFGRKLPAAAQILAVGRGTAARWCISPLRFPAIHSARKS